ncbi:MAG: NAD(P)H-hydrate dehydratase [Lachnospiraceae bacterium]|nr:NAD(P)H-hydrate dehydratase [Lachnospiraceae bacterium]
MEYLVTAEEARNIDKYTIENADVPSLVLMERAALAVAENAAALAEEAFGPGARETARVISVCGSGNNGGDGIAAARILFIRGWNSCIYLAGDAEKMSEDCRKQFEIAQNMKVPVLESYEAGRGDVLIDAVFGTGLTRDIGGKYAAEIEKINHARESGARICAVDMPSGVHTDTGRVMGNAVKADVTVTFGYRKTGQIFYPGASLCGRTVCAEIGFSPEASEKAGLKFMTYRDEDISRIPERRPDSHKGSCGKVLVIAGSKNMAGAAYLSAKAAYRTGCGLVTVYTPESNRVILQELVPEAVMKTYEDGGSDFTGLETLIAEVSAVVLGPGLGTSLTSRELVKKVLLISTGKIIIDADALNIISEDTGILSDCRAEIAVTPHKKELSRLTGIPVSELDSDLPGTCEEFSRKYNVILAAKDARTLVTDAGGAVYINSSGNSGMSTGGSGDVLTGIIAGLAAMGADLPEAVRLGVFIHGKVGDAAARRLGEYSMTSGDILDALPEVFSLRRN